MLAKLSSFLAWSSPYRQQYGHLAGLRFALDWRRATYAAEVGTPVRVNVPGVRHPLCLRSQTADVTVFEQIFLRHEVAFPLASDPKVIVDGGANIGLST